MTQPFKTPTNRLEIQHALIDGLTVMWVKNNVEFRVQGTRPWGEDGGFLVWLTANDKWEQAELAEVRIYPKKALAVSGE